MYQSILWASFQSPESFQRVPKEGDSFQIPAPKLDPAAPGGVGFHELQQLLQPVDFDGSIPSINTQHPGPIMQSILGGPEVLSVKVERAREFYHMFRGNLQVL